MNTSLKHLSPAHRDKLEKAVRIIVRAVLPEKIILFGGVHDLPGAIDLLVIGAYNLLVVTRQGDRRSD